MKGLIFNIARFSVHDGPGIRVTIFMKGCPLSCKWCHNPEGIFDGKETVSSSCRVGELEFNRNEVAGEYRSAGDILSILGRERIFMDHSGGGVTFSGGEPMLQSAFLIEALTECKDAGYHTVIDTSGHAPAESFLSVLPLTDLFLFDLKHLDEDKHIEATGATNSIILSNYRLLLENRAKMILRIPVIPGFNDDPGHIEMLTSFIISTKRDSLGQISLLPFHNTGASKYRRFSMAYRMEGTEPPSDEHMSTNRNKLLTTGIKVKIGG